MDFINFDTWIFCPLISDIKLYYQFNVEKWFLCRFFLPENELFIIAYINTIGQVQTI
jgi:hypothetical protein